METKRYQKNERFTILWTPSKCTHAGVCVRTLPEVYHPKDKPWILPEKGEIEALKDQIQNCPSGALGYEEL
jgi:uncharacterized Fe-S cluster protein YjdI